MIGVERSDGDTRAEIAPVRDLVQLPHLNFETVRFSSLVSLGLWLAVNERVFLHA